MRTRRFIKMTDRALDARLAKLHRSLSDLADRHAEFVEGLKPIAPAAWTHDQII
jgi:hypothetical protein